MGHRRIEDIKINKRAPVRQAPPSMERPTKRKAMFSRPPTQHSHDRGARGEGPRVVLWVIAVIAILSVGAAFFGIFSGATITLTPRQDDGFVDAAFAAVRDGGNTGAIAFDTIILTGEQTVETKATKEEFVDRKASGQIIIYNDFNSQPQELVRNTRFETPDGKIYRIREGVVVPGQKEEGGKTTPGSLEVTVYADEPGEEYNIGLTDFTIPGFAGTARFDGFFARSKTPMEGGFSGVVLSPDEEELKIKRTELQNALSAKLKEDIAAQVPADFILFPDLVLITFEESPRVTQIDKDTVSVTEHATIQGIVFRKDILSQFLAKETLASYDGAPVNIRSFEGIKASFVNPEGMPPVGEEVEIAFSGGFSVVWDTNEDLLKEKLVATPKKSFNAVLAEFPHIERAQASIRPFWKRVFPEKTNDIELEFVLDDES